MKEDIKILNKIKDLHVKKVSVEGYSLMLSD